MPKDELLVVTQADRIAAANNWLTRALAAHGEQQPWMVGVMNDILAGVCDGTPEVQAFARHRLTAIAEEREACAKVADVWKATAPVAGPQALVIASAISIAAGDIATAIRSRSTPQGGSDVG